MSKPKNTPAHTLTHKPQERMGYLRSMSIPERSAVFSKLSPYVQQSILKQLKNDEIVDMIDHMDMQQAEHVVKRIASKKRREKIILKLKGEIKEKMDYFLRFHPEASLSLVNFNYLFLADDMKVGEAAEIIDEHFEETGKFPEVLVHKTGDLIGEVPFGALVRERNSSLLGKHVKPIESITYQAEINKIIDTLVSTGKRKVVVLDHDTSVLGIIYSDAAQALFGHLPAESLYDFAGVADSEKPFDSIGKKVKHRYRWLILNLFTSFLAGSVVLFFQDIIDMVTILSVYIPIIAGMGGNAATQTFAIMVRGLTLGTVSLRTAGPVIWRELGAGVLNGAIVGSIVALISLLWNGDPILGAIVAVAMIGSHIVAGVAGSFIPLFMKHIGKDPASTSTMFITTATDVLGLFFLLGLASIFLL